MLLWRISNYADLLGIGALGSSGRWHHAGKPVVYLAENPSSSLLEVLVHLEVDEEDLPDTYQLITVEITEGISVNEVDVSSLPLSWENQLEHTREIGDVWLQESRSALLRVPSAITPETYNWLFNPKHAEASKVKIIKADRHRYDSRLFRSSK
jgi:RES domain-containing protein